MSKHKIWTLTLLVALFSGIPGMTPLCMAMPVQGKILHSPPHQYVMGQEVELEAVVEGTGQNVSDVSLLFRPADESEFIETPMEFRYGYYYGTIPSQYSTPAGINYLIVAKLADGTAITYPAENPYENPVTIEPAGGYQSHSENQVSREKKYADDYTLQSKELILSPAPGAVLSKDNILLAVSLFTVPDVDVNSIQIYLDGVNITKRAEITRELVTYRADGLRSGTHGVRLLLTDAAGRQYEPLIWNFTTSETGAEKQNKFQYSGRLSVATSSNQIRDQKENINQLNGSFRGSYGPVNITSHVYLTSKENPSKQPRNRYSIGLSSSHFTMQIGDSYPRLSRLGMWGKRIRGIDAQLFLNAFNLQVVYGRSERGIPGYDTTSVTGDSLFLRNYTFGRRVLAIRPSFGSGKHFQLGFSFISSRDDTTSVFNNYNDYNRILWEGAKPKDNAVIGTDLTLAFDQHRVVWESQAAVSWRNENILGGALSQGDTLRFGGDRARILVSDMPINPQTFEKFFVINNNVQPLLPIPATVDTNYNISLHPWRLRDYTSLAWQTKLNLNYYKNFVTFQYKYVGPEYTSFTNPYIRKDIAGLEISDRVRLLENKLFLTLSYQNQDEGLTRSNTYQISTSAFSAGVSYYPGENYPSVNVTLNNYARGNGIESLQLRPDSLGGNIDNRIDNNTFSSTLSITQGLSFLGFNHTLDVNFIRSSKTDAFNRAGLENTNNLISLGLRTQYDFPLLTRLFFNFNNSKTGSAKTQFAIIGASGSMRLLNNNLYLSSTIRHTNASGMVTFQKSDIDLAVRYQFLENQQISANSRLAFTSGTSLGNYTDSVLQLRYTYQF